MLWKGAHIVVNPTRQHAHRFIVHLLLTVVGMTGIVGLFLPFTFGTSPLEAASTKEFWRLALPFFLTVLASAASIRWVISGSFSGGERAIAYVISVSVAGLTLSMSFPFYGRPGNIQEWLTMLSPYPIFALGLYFLNRNSRMGPSREFNPVLAIQVAYLANTVMCLIAFFGDWEKGAYCTLVAALAFVLQIVLASRVAGN